MLAPQVRPQHPRMRTPLQPSEQEVRFVHPQLVVSSTRQRGRQRHG